MITLKSLSLDQAPTRTAGKLGTISHLVIFAWSMGTVMLAPGKVLPIAGGLALLVAGLIYPRAFQRLVQPRWILMIGLLALPPLFILGDLDRSLWGLPYSSEGLLSSLQIILRVIVVLVSVNGFTSAVEIAAIAGLLERFGLHGLGFSIGVALNLLPCLQKSAQQTWHSLWLRGGLRNNRWRGIRLLLMTIITNALRRTEEIALAAEGRAFNPEHCQPMPLQPGTLDRVILLAAVFLSIGFGLITILV